MREAIYHERRVELCFEQQRYFDLVRWGNIDTKIRQVVNTCSGFLLDDSPLFYQYYLLKYLLRTQYPSCHRHDL